MPATIRTAEPADLETMTTLLVADAAERNAADPALWKPAPNIREKVSAGLQAAMEAENPPFRQHWLLAEAGGQVVGITHSILLPVPPIYAGEFGPPGLIMEDCFVSPDAPDGTAEALLEAAEADLRKAGAKIILGSSIAGGAWEALYAKQNYQPLTLYLAKSGLAPPQACEGTRDATEADLPSIVASSAENRQILFDLDPFWKPHEEADQRFGAWMAKSLTLPDRDMFISEIGEDFRGYAISHPATPLHFPAPHDISGIGVIDDYFHSDFADPDTLKNSGTAAANLLQSAEAALQTRGNEAALIVCPAAWISKIALLEGAGYTTAISWFIKR